MIILISDYEWLTFQEVYQLSNDIGSSMRRLIPDVNYKIIKKKTQ